jgi:hypothetical protein
MWVKRGIINDPSVFETLIGGGPTNADTFGFGSGTNAAGDYLHIRDSAVGSYNLLTTQLFRDPSSWYHLVLAVDTTQATASNRIKLYVNGAQVTSFSSASYPAQNYVFDWNTASTVCAIGRRSGGNASWYYDGYLAEMYFVDGQQLTPSSFGAISTNGAWQPTAYTGTYGTNGFYLKFNSYATAAALGTDSSGNGNTWTVNNLSVTAGATYDSMTDVPTLTSATTANYAVLNPLALGSTVTLSNGNLTMTEVGTFATTVSTMAMTSGKWYAEMTAGSNTYAGTVGIARLGYSPTSRLGFQANTWSYNNDGGLYYNSITLATVSSYTTGDVIGIAFDPTNLTIAFYKNNTLQTTQFTAANSGLTAGEFYFATGHINSTSNWNFGQQGFVYTPPSGFVALNTYNLSTPTIPNGAVYMAATTYTGTGASLTVANTVNGTNFQPDWVWVKGRSGATDHAWYDVLRGTTKQLESNTTTAETTEATGLTAFGSTGFTVGALAQMNTSAATYVAWQWKANGAGVTNTAGSITSTVSANTTAGFSVVTYTGTGANATVGHGLGVAPSFIIAKSRSIAGAQWPVYSSVLGASAFINIDSAAAATTGNTTVWQGVTPTSTVFSVSTSNQANGSAATYVAYCFTPIAGYSAFGSYTGNGSADGPFVYTGFRPRFIMVKCSSAVGGWDIFDTSRNPYNVENAWLAAQSAAAESTSTLSLDGLSNGFKLRQTDQDINGSGQTYIYMAFAENPFKYSLAR